MHIFLNNYENDINENNDANDINNIGDNYSAIIGILMTLLTGSGTVLIMNMIIEIRLHHQQWY